MKTARTLSDPAVFQRYPRAAVCARGLCFLGLEKGQRFIELVVSLVSVSPRLRITLVVAQTAELASTGRRMFSNLVFNHSHHLCHCQSTLRATLFETTCCTFQDVKIDDRFCEPLTSVTSPKCSNEMISWSRFVVLDASGPVNTIPPIQQNPT